MNILNAPRRRLAADRPRLLIYCLLLSLLLHLLIVLLLPLIRTDQEATLQQQPTIVRLVEPPTEKQSQANQEPGKYELDPLPELPELPEPETPVESIRKADRDQQVEQEQAPRGEDSRDEVAALPTPARPLPPATPPPPQPAAPSQPAQQTPATPSQEPQQPSPSVTQQEPATRKTPSPSAEPAAPPQEQSPPASLSPEQLLPDAKTLNRIASGKLGERDRVKERDDVEIGDTVWLNLQHDLLVSFFRRFHDQVERVWNYPTEAAMNGIEGTLELLIIVDKKGELIDVDLRQSSGSDLLDFEAIQAVYRAAPFGPMTSHYPHEQLKIRAHFRYTLGGRIIYGL